jgi:DNA-binding LacI/PurR family transcriptional regulator
VNVHKRLLLAIDERFDEGVDVSAEAARQATMLDVASRAGVSYQTVSRVINQHASVAPATRARVLEAIRELEYLPNGAARNLVTRRSRTVGIVSFGTGYYGPSQMLAHIDRSFRERAYGLTLATLSELGLAELRIAVRELRSRSVDGIVMIAPMLRVDVDAVRRLCGTVPFVMVDIALGGELPSVLIDQRYGGMLAARHLLELGHRSIAEITGPLDWSGAELRHAGTLAVLDEAGLAPVMSVAGDWSAGSGHRAAGRLLETDTPFTAVVASNDQMALGAMRALREGGRRVPEDVSVVGFDDVPESAYFEPPLTTVRQDFASLGRASAAYLIDLIEGGATSLSQRVLDPELIVRGSTRQRG